MMRVCLGAHARYKAGKDHLIKSCTVIIKKSSGGPWLGVYYSSCNNLAFGVMWRLRGQFLGKLIIHTWTEFSLCLSVLYLPCYEVCPHPHADCSSSPAVVSDCSGFGLCCPEPAGADSVCS